MSRKTIERLRRRAGTAGEVADAGIAWLERQAKKTADMDVPVLSGAAKALQPLYAGARAAIAHATSGGGKYYQPEVRDERYFSNDALRLMAKNLARHGGKGMSRYDYGKPSPAMWEASQAVGGATVKDGKVTDAFDVDTKDPYGLSDGARLVNSGLGAAVDLGHRALGLVFGDERDPAAGKVRTEVPLDAIRRVAVRQGAKGDAGGAPSFQKDYRYTDPLFTPDGQRRIKDIVGKTSPRPESDGLTREPYKLVPGWTPPDLNPKPYYPGAGESEKILLRQDAKGGDAGGEVTENAETVSSGEIADTPVTNGPRIVVNPKVFKDKRDALCVAYNEAFRVVMELNGFEPAAEPTETQRRFFADTAYAGDETMLRRTILARICTFDTSVDAPTDEQLEEAVEFLDAVMEIGAPRTTEEQASVKRIRDVLAAARNAPRPA